MTYSKEFKQLKHNNDVSFFVGDTRVVMFVVARSFMFAFDIKTNPDIISKDR